MSMPLCYKDKRDELDELLWHFSVPRSLYYRLLDLREFLLHKIQIFDSEDHEKLLRAIEIVEEIMPRIRNGE